MFLLLVQLKNGGKYQQFFAHRYSVFVLSGIIMNNGGIAKKLVDFAMLFVGRVPGLWLMRMC